jgi:hypothetical protein
MARDLAPDVERLLENPIPYIRKKAALCTIRSAVSSTISGSICVTSAMLPTSAMLLVSLSGWLLHSGCRLSWCHTAASAAAEYTMQQDGGIPVYCNDNSSASSTSSVISSCSVISAV